MTIQAKSSKSAVYLLNRYGIADAARIRVTTQILGTEERGRAAEKMKTMAFCRDLNAHIRF